MNMDELKSDKEIYEMNMDELKSDLETLKRQREDAVAHANALSGAIQYVEQKIRQVELAVSDRHDINNPLPEPPIGRD
jgi:chromosome segregation ATPase